MHAWCTLPYGIIEHPAVHSQCQYTRAGSAAQPRREGSRPREASAAAVGLPSGMARRQRNAEFAVAARRLSVQLSTACVAVALCAGCGGAVVLCLWPRCQVTKNSALWSTCASPLSAKHCDCASSMTHCGASRSSSLMHTEPIPILRRMPCTSMQVTDSHHHGVPVQTPAQAFSPGRRPRSGQDSNV